MALTFDLLRANDLIWNYVSSNWLMGEDPPAFDVLAWNADSPHARGHALVLPAHLLPGQPAGPGRDGAGRGAAAPGHGDPGPVPGRGGQRPHHPLEVVYGTTQLVKGHTRFVLSSSGHIAGIVNPPSPKARHWTNEETPADPDVWQAGATSANRSSWWDDWVALGQGPAANAASPRPWATPSTPIAEAPGNYIHE